MVSKEVLILQHVANEGAGTIRAYMEMHAIPFRFIRLFQNEPLPVSLNKVLAVLIMGGPMNVYEDEKFPFLKAEDLFIKQLIKENIPILGVCLGAQLLAKALGAKVFKAKTPEIGWGDVEISQGGAKDPLFSGLKSEVLQVLQWHGDTFDLPEGAVHLASSMIVSNQAFRYQDHFYRFQFHVEVDRPILEDWFKNPRIQAPVLKEYDDYKSKLSAITESIYRNFFKLSP
jgi:GMP synthase-like glutamine amidotransferase